MSISKAQAEALAEGFLDTIGSSRGELNFRPKKTITEFLVLAGELVQEANDNLIQSRAIATGKLAESITAEEPIQYGNVLQVDISMLFYGMFIDQGVKGTRGGSGLYQFRNEFPSKNMVAAIQEWIDNARIRIRTVKKYSGYGSNEIKNRRVAESGAAYAMAKSIKINGIRPRGFMSKAISSMERKVQDRLGLVLVADLSNTIDQISDEWR